MNLSPQTSSCGRPDTPLVSSRNLRPPWDSLATLSSVVLMIMMATYKESQSGAEMWDAVTCERIRCWIISYVDDNTLVQHFRYSDSVNYILQEMKKSLQEWHTL